MGQDSEIPWDGWPFAPDVQWRDHKYVLPDDKIALWAALIDEIISKGSIQHKQLEKLIGGVSFTQTSVYGRCGRTLLKTLCRKLHSHPHLSALSTPETNLLAWWADFIRAARPRQVLIKQKFPEIVIYTDAATSAAILSAVVIEVQQFANDNSFRRLLPMWPTMIGRLSSMIQP